MLRSPSQAPHNQRRSAREDEGDKILRDDAKPWLCSLAYVRVMADGAASEGYGSWITLDTIVTGIQGGTLFRRLQLALPRPWNFSMFEAEKEQGARVLAALRTVMDQPDPPWRWSCGGQCAGLRFLSALAFEAMLRHHWVL
jgi:hypothetical protein